MVSVLILATACSPPYRNLREYALNRDGFRALAVIQNEAGSTWGAVDDGNRIHILPAPPDTLSRIDDVLLSPDQELLAIVSVAEGHPYLQVYHVKSFLDSAQPYGDSLGSDKDFIEAFRTVNPYPVSLNQVRWLGPSTLTFVSDIDFSGFDRETRCGELPEQPKEHEWTYDVAGDRFIP